MSHEERNAFVLQHQRLVRGAVGQAIRIDDSRAVNIARSMAREDEEPED